MTKQERAQFVAFCQNATDRQLPNIYQKERDAGRFDYAAIAEVEAARRGVSLD